MPTLITRDYAVSRKRSYQLSTTYYASLIGSLHSDPARDDAAMLMKRDGKLSYLRAYMTLSGGNGTGSVTLLQKLALTGTWTTPGLSVEIPSSGTDQLLVDDESEVEFSAGDKLCWEIVSNASFGQGMALRYIVVRVEDQ